MHITDLEGQLSFALDTRAETLTRDILSMAASEQDGEMLVIVAEGPRHLLEHILSHSAPYQITDDVPTPMMAVAFPASDPEGAYVRRAAEAHPGLTVKASLVPARDILTIT